MKNTATITDIKTRATAPNFNSDQTTKVIIALEMDVPAPKPITSMEEWADNWRGDDEERGAQFKREAEAELKRRAAAAAPKTKGGKKKPAAPSLTCDECGATFADADALDEHDCPGPTPCPICREEYCECPPAIDNAELVAMLTPHYEAFVAWRRERNAEALLAAQELGMLMLLLRREVSVELTPIQQGFANLLALAP